MATTSRRARSPEAIAKQKATLARKKRAKLRAQAQAQAVQVDVPVTLRKAGIRQGKAVELVDHRTGDKNPNQINFTGLRDFVAFEVARQLPAIVAAEMTKRLGGGS